MYHDDWIGDLIGTFLLGTSCYYAGKGSAEEAHKKLEEKRKEREIQDLKDQLAELKRKLN